MRVAVIDVGTNSTRLLVADVADDGRLTERVRRTKVTRLGDRLGETGVLGDDAMARVLETLGDYGAAIDAGRVDRAVAVLTSAVRDAANGEAFLARVRDQHAGIEARVIGGDEEARLTFRGATSERAATDAPTLVVDVGGGSTELVVGSGDEVSFHASTQAGVVRHTERHLASDPPTPAELNALAEDVRAIYREAVPASVLARRDRPGFGVFRGERHARPRCVPRRLPGDPRAPRRPSRGGALPGPRIAPRPRSDHRRRGGHGHRGSGAVRPRCHRGFRP
jgi:exopolyphosphatase / guanosine-5'-triphosphate,3'-diphosphate pyrophosphatase